MSTLARLHAVLFILALSACAGDPGGSAGHDDPLRDQEVLVPPVFEMGPASAQGTSPMPALGFRVDRVLEELGDEAQIVRLGPIEGSNTREARRERLAALSPRARASLRRHNVRIEQLTARLERVPAPNASALPSDGDDR